jgi:hypothetical protein
VAEGSVGDIVGGRRVVEVTAPDWPAALAAVQADLDRASIDARVRLVPASLNETLVELSRAAGPGSRRAGRV